MKKRLTSMLLVVVMLVSMIPALSVATTAATNPTSHKTVLTGDNIAVDGTLDDAYSYSQKITPVYWLAGSESTVDFEAYVVTTIRGIYVWAEIKDNTLNKSTSSAVGDGDKFQIYLRLNNGTQDTWGWYETDYNGKTSVVTQGSVSLTASTTVTAKLPDNSGWRSETFIPFGNVDPMSVYNMGISMGFQVNNEVAGGTRYGLCYSHTSGGSFWSGNSNYVPLSITPLGDAYRDGTRKKTAVYISSAPTIDGTKDSVYSDHAKVTIRNVNTGYGFENDKRTDLGELYIAFDASNVYLYYEVYDKDLTSKDYCQIYYDFYNNGKGDRAGYFCTKIDPAGEAFYGSTGSSYGYPGTPYTASNVTIGRKALGNDRYGLEFKLPIPVYDRTKLKNEGTLDIKLAFSANDYADYTPEGATGDTADRRAHGGCTPASSGMYNYNAFAYRFPEVTLSKSFTDETPGIIRGASVALGSDISINYFALVSPEDVDNAYMKFTKGGKEYIVYPKASVANASVSRECTFSFKGIAPQTIGDNIKAELYVGGKLVSTRDNYSVLTNCLNLYNNESYSDSSYNNMKWLISSLLNYSAAAQKYMSYKTDTLVDDGYNIDLLSPTSSVKSVGSPISSTFKMTTAGVRFNSSNNIYVKFIAPSLSGVTLTIDGKPAAIQAVEGEANTYIAYSNDIPVLHFSREYRIVLSNGTSSQTAIYSVNSYAYAKLTSSNSKMVELAKATYTYGEYARKYANLAAGSYKIMTINDGDSGFYSNGNYKYVSEIIKHYAPDIVGMQEVQKNDATSRYPGQLSEYGVVYYKHGSSAGNHSASEALSANEYGNVILYRKDKFTLVDSGRQWLSSTPDTASRVEDSDYTRTYVWAKLRDKQTGKTFVFVSTHIDYVITAGVQQVQILMDLTKAKFGNLPIIYTADWNKSVGHEVLSAMTGAGYVPTEDLVANLYKPASTIDICFVHPDVFSAYDYKYIDTYDYDDSIDYLSQVTDHPIIFTEIVFMEKTASQPLPDGSDSDLEPETPTSAFHSDDDEF